MPPIYIWTNDAGKEFGAEADSVEEARKELDDSPIITDHQAQIAHDNPPDKIVPGNSSDDEKG